MILNGNQLKSPGNTDEKQVQYLQAWKSFVFFFVSFGISIAIPELFLNNS